jgi:SAM-dependent methyltransferase
MEPYVIRGGKEGYERLLLLARDRWPDTAALFARAGVSPGMRCIDLGCGSGAVSLEIARLVTPGGHVTGVDIDETKLDLARRSADADNLTNVEFRALNLRAWAEPSTYDMVYCRFVLQHLSQPVDLLRGMWAAVRQGGVLVVEDADMDAFSCHPPDGAFEFFVSAYGRVLERRGGDSAIGRKLFGYFHDASIRRPQAALVQSVWTEGEGKMLPWTTLEASADAITSEGIATKEEVAHALATLERFSADPRTLICGPRVFQLWSRRLNVAA